MCCYLIQSQTTSRYSSVLGLVSHERANVHWMNHMCTKSKIATSKIKSLFSPLFSPYLFSFFYPIHVFCLVFFIKEEFVFYLFIHLSLSSSRDLWVS